MGGHEKQIPHANDTVLDTVLYMRLYASTVVHLVIGESWILYSNLTLYKEDDFSPQ